LSILIFIISTFSSFAGDHPGKVFTVTIDAGHGGHDPGTHGKKAQEKKIALAIALKVGQYIESLMDDVHVVYTRKTDVFIPLEERANIANRNKSDLFISIHVDGFKTSTPSGTSSYVMGSSKSAKNFELVQKENRVILLEEDHEAKYEGFDPTSPESYIIFSLYQNVNLSQSLAFATQVQDQLRIKGGRQDRGVYQEPFLILWKTTMPSVLIETGFLTNLREEEFLISENGQDVIASAIFTAFRKYKQDQNPVDQAQATETTPARRTDVAEQTTKTVETATSVKQPVQVKKDTLHVKIGIQPPKQDTHESKANPEIVTKADAPAIEFRVQVIASSKKLPASAPDFKGKKGFMEFHVDGYYKYMTQPVKSHQEAVELRKSLLPFFKGAFIVAFKEGVRIPLDQAVSETH
jgi:N-acetylmuramoyl-L-alanine amidase